MKVIELSDAAVEMEGQAGRSSGFTLSIEAGESFALVGPNRAGKSLVLKLCTGMVKPSRGTVRVLGTDLAAIGQEELVALRQRVGTVLEPPGLLSNMTVFNNVALPLRYHRNLADTEVVPLVMARLESLGVAHLRDRFPAELNQGEVRCAAIARAVILDQEVLLLDDPLEGMDAGMVRRLGDWLGEQRRSRHLTILATTNRPSTLLAMVDRLGLVLDGTIRAAGPYEKVLAEAGADMQDYVQVQ